MGWNLSNSQKANLQEVRYNVLALRAWTSHLSSPGLSLHQMNRNKWSGGRLDGSVS